MDQGIDVRRQKFGTTIYVECATQLFEMEVVNPEYGLVRVNSNVSALRIPTVGQLVESIGPEGAKPTWIGEGMAMHLRFRNGVFPTEPALAASIKGKGWEYEVFDSPARAEALNP
jgi:hypothetical protein